MLLSEEPVSLLNTILTGALAAEGTTAVGAAAVVVCVLGCVGESGGGGGGGVTLEVGVVGVSNTWSNTSATACGGSVCVWMKVCAMGCVGQSYDAVSCMYNIVLQTLYIMYTPPPSHTWRTVAAAVLSTLSLFRVLESNLKHTPSIRQTCID